MKRPGIGRYSLDECRDRQSDASVSVRPGWERCPPDRSDCPFRKLYKHSEPLKGDPDVVVELRRE